MLVPSACQPAPGDVTHANVAQPNLPRRHGIHPAGARVPDCARSERALRTRQPLQMTREREQQPEQDRMARPHPRRDPNHQDMHTRREVRHGDNPPPRPHRAPEREPLPRRQRTDDFKCGRSPGSSAQNRSIWPRGHDQPPGWAPHTKSALYGLQLTDHELFITVCRHLLPAPDRDMTHLYGPGTRHQRLAAPAAPGRRGQGPGHPAIGRPAGTSQEARLADARTDRSAMLRTVAGRGTYRVLGVDRFVDRVAG